MDGTAVVETVNTGTVGGVGMVKAPMVVDTNSTPTEINNVVIIHLDEIMIAAGTKMKQEVLRRSSDSLLSLLGAKVIYPKYTLLVYSLRV